MAEKLTPHDFVRAALAVEVGSRVTPTALGTWTGYGGASSRSNSKGMVSVPLRVGQSIQRQRGENCPCRA